MKKNKPYLRKTKVSTLGRISQPRFSQLSPKCNVATAKVTANSATTTSTEERLTRQRAATITYIETSTGSVQRDPLTAPLGSAPNVPGRKAVTPNIYAFSKCFSVSEL